MIDLNILNPEIIEKLFDNKNKFIFLIEKDTKILDFNKNFEEYKDKFKYLKDFTTYTHHKSLFKSIDELNCENKIKKVNTNFSLEGGSVEDIPSSYDLVLYLNENDKILVVAEEKPALSHTDAREYLSMINEFSTASRELAKTKNSLEKKNFELNEVSEKLKVLNKNLETKVEEAVNELREKDKLLLRQTKDAAMGAMIDAIAHQWKNPLGVVSLINQQIQIQCLLSDTLNKEEVSKFVNKSEKQVKHLIETLDEFRSFFRPKAKLQKVSIQILLDSVTILMKDELIKNQIEIKKEGRLEEKITIVLNEFKHVLINLINNSKDAFISNNIKNRRITVTASIEGKLTILRISDNAKGIPPSILERVFESNFTTKESKGTGVGLYMTKQIVEKLGGKIEVSNEKDGACFKITLKN